MLMGSLCYMFLYESCHYHNHHWNCIYVCDGFTVDIVFMCLIIVVIFIFQPQQFCAFHCMKHQETNSMLGLNSSSSYFVLANINFCNFDSMLCL